MQTLAQLSSGKLRGATSLKLSEGLDKFPDEIFSLSETLEYLDLSSNHLTELPANFGSLKKLKVFFASNNLFSELPDVLGECPELSIVGFKSNLIEYISPSAINTNLKWLILTNNRIAHLPDTIGICKNMQKLMLAGNRLTGLPVTLQQCNKLELLRIAANELTEIPHWLLEMPSLAWLAFSGNPTLSSLSHHHLSAIDAKHIDLHEVLGEGASGTIYRASMQDNDSLKEVAVKIFKGEVTSDGYPEDELKAYISAGHHPSIVNLIGTLKGLAGDKKGMIMDLIPSDYFNLGKPPSLITCTRDVFENTDLLSLQQVFKIAYNMASVGAHLHRHGILHGDLYAHNILINKEGNTLFGDFGAASFYDNIDDKNLARCLERIEVKAYGYLLEDLLSVCYESDNTFYHTITSISTQCLSGKQDTRPTFEEILSNLEQLNPIN